MVVPTLKTTLSRGVSAEESKREAKKTRSESWRKLRGLNRLNFRGAVDPRARKRPRTAALQDAVARHGAPGLPPGLGVRLSPAAFLEPNRLFGPLVGNAKVMVRQCGNRCGRRSRCR